jgi:hypothetical protein
MPRQHSVTLYKFDELSPAAQRKAIDKHTADPNAPYPHEFWADTTLDDSKEIAKLLGFDVSGLMIFYSGFYSQGDGACVTGKWNADSLDVKALKEYAPQDTQLQSIAERLAHWVQFYPKAYAYLSHRGNYYHAHSIDFELEVGEDEDGEAKEWTSLADTDLRNILRDFMNWIFDRLRTEYEWHFQDEQVKEDIRQGDYEFTEDGRKYGG